MSADTVVPQAGHPQALNRFACVLNNPLRYIDPSGHRPNQDWLEPDTDLEVKPGYGNRKGITRGESPQAHDAESGCKGHPDSVWVAVAAPFLVVGGGAAGGAAIDLTVIAATKAVAAVSALLASLSADGDPTNEVRTIVDVADEVSYPQWAEQLYRFSDRAGNMQYSLRPGEDAASMASVSDFSSVAEAFKSVMGRSPGPNDFYQVTDVWSLWTRGFYPYYDSLQAGNPFGHVSVYGNQWGKVFEAVFFWPKMPVIGN